MNLYKYMPSIHAEAALNFGTFRIGTLYDFRDTDLHSNPAIGDQQEGIFSRFATNETLDSKNFNTMSGIRLAGGAKLVMTGGASFRVTSQVKNLYVFCVSKRNDQELLREFSSDAILEVSELMAFAKTMTQGFPVPVTFMGVFECAYRERSAHHQAQVSAPFFAIKEEKYRHQEEVRLVWAPLDTVAISPFVKDFSDARRFIKKLI